MYDVVKRVCAPMEVEMGEDDARNPTGDFVIKGERRGTQCFEWTCKCCKGKFVGRLHKLQRMQIL